MRHNTHNKAPFLFAVTAIVSFFMIAPMLLSVMAGLVNNHSVGLKSGLTTRWFVEVWEVYGGTVGWSLVLALVCVVGTVLLGVPCAYALARSRSRAARIFEELLTLPVAVPVRLAILEMAEVRKTGNRAATKALAAAAALEEILTTALAAVVA